jgi:hypothetical protein
MRKILFNFLSVCIQLSTWLSSWHVSVVKNSHIIHDDLRNLQMTRRVVTSMNSSLSRLETSSSSLRNQNSSPSVSYSPLGLEVTEMRKRQLRIRPLGALESQQKEVIPRIETELPLASLVFTLGDI